MGDEFFAHVREIDKKPQTLEQHLVEVATASSAFSEKQGLGLGGELIGLVHDLGKYSQVFQAYLKSAQGILNPDEDEEFVDATKLKGKVDHSTAGAQLVWQHLSGQGPLGQITGQILALCIASHHSGLIDCLTSDPSSSGEDAFSRRMVKPEEKVHLEEALLKVEPEIQERFRALLSDQELINSLKKIISNIIEHSPEKSDRSVVARFQIGLLVRYLFSCLIDADRLSTADFEKPHVAQQRLNGGFVSWEELVQRLETHLISIPPINQKIDDIRQGISQHCRDASFREKGLFTLTVPTGGGKTLSSLRFALRHANKHKLDRVIYVIPFTTIIDQNAKVARQALEPESQPLDKGRIVLEHHSNLAPEAQSWRGKILSENWDAPIIYTTSVQFLEALFGAGTRGARRMHQLANAVIVFDEIQTLPVRCVHLFNNAINFLVDHCSSSVVLCTATQPLLGEVDPKKGAARISAGNEIMPNVQEIFDALKRVDVHDQRKAGGWSEEDICDLAQSELRKAGSCLVVVNTKKKAKGLYRRLEGLAAMPLYHLSTSMCPAHRREVLASVRGHLSQKEPVLCISTQLIEAGVDVDFGSVIRLAAGLDSIAQAAGRCNRNASRDTGAVHVVNPSEENLKPLDDIRIGRDKANRVLDDFKDRPEDFHGGLIGPNAMAWYYRNYFFDRKNEMDYPVKSDRIGRDDTLLNLLSTNPLAVGEFGRIHGGKGPAIYLRQSFMAAAKAFQAIDAPTRGVIVQYGKDGQDLVIELCATHEVEKQYSLLRRAQAFSVNVFPHEFEKLVKQRALVEVQQGVDIYYLHKAYYSENFGLSTEPVVPGESGND